jgi:UDP-glucose 4-epimerase
VLRLFNVYGPGQTGPYASVITKFVERAKRGLPPVVYGDGTQTRDFVHVADVAHFVEVSSTAAPPASTTWGLAEPSR